MKIIIAGAGRIGGTVAKILAAEGHDITVIEKTPETIYTTSNELDVICIEGNATNSETLKEAGAESADLLIAATEKDEINMVCGISARKLGTKNVIARIRDPEYLQQSQFLIDTLGLSIIINPEYECAKEISRILRFPGAMRVDSFSKSTAEIVEHKVKEGGKLEGVMLKDFGQKFNAKVLVCAVERNGEAYIPKGDFTVKAGDRLSILGSSRELRKFFIELGEYKKPVKDVIIMGGGRTGVYLTNLLREVGIDVSIIELDRKRCEELTDLVPEAHIVCADAARSDALLEENIMNVGGFVALTGDDGDNIVTSLYAADCGVEKIVTKVNYDNYAAMLQDSKLESLVTPKNVTAQQVARYARAMEHSVGSSMETLYRLADGMVEAIEFKVEEGRSTGIPLKDLKLRKNVLIAAVIRGTRTIIPNGASTIMPGDHVIVVTTAGWLKDLDSVLEDAAQ